MSARPLHPVSVAARCSFSPLSALLLCSYLDGLRAYWHKDHLTYGAARLLGRRLLERGVPAPVREWVARARPAALPPAVSYYAFVDGQ